MATTLRIAHTARYMIVAIPKPVHGRQHGFMPRLKVNQLHGVDGRSIPLDNVVGPLPAPPAAAQPQPLPLASLPSLCSHHGKCSFPQLHLPYRHPLSPSRPRLYYRSLPHQALSCRQLPVEFPSPRLPSRAPKLRRRLERTRALFVSLKSTLISEVVLGLTWKL